MGLNRPNCPHCKNSHVIKYGHVKGTQRYQCNNCHFQFTRLTQCGVSAPIKALAFFLVLNGLSFKAAGKLVGVSGVSVGNWVDAQAKKLKHLVPEGLKPEVIEMDEIWYYLEKKDISVRSGLP